MIYDVENGKINTVQPQNIQTGDTKPYWATFSFAQLEDAGQTFGLDVSFFTDAFDNRANRFEGHDGFDFICVNVFDRRNVALPFARVYIYLSKNLLIFFSDKPSFIENMMEAIPADTVKGAGFAKPLYTFFDRITEKDAEFLEDIEQDISDLENDLILSKRKSCVVEIVTLRKKLMALKRYYEQLLHVLELIQENENNLIDKKAMRYFKMFESRVDRLYHSVLNLRDYVTQVREAYQAQVDINLNNTMKLFTVITAIFLPLSLIVGWYGMNLKMPEFGWVYGYPMVIALSAGVAVFSIVYFKKNKWF